MPLEAALCGTASMGFAKGGSLETILPGSGPLKAFFQRVDEVKMAIQVQEDIEMLLYHCNERSAATLIDRMYSKNIASG